jgi:hypothetical protein
VTAGPLARVGVRVVLGGATALAVVLFGLSLVPSATLAGRLMGVAGDARAGPFYQELAAYLDERLRLAGVVILVLVGGLAVLRAAFEDLIDACARDFACIRWRWTDRSTLLTVGGLMLVAVIVRVQFLGQPMRYDEALTFNEFASRPLYYGLSFYPDPNNHLLNTLLMHLSVAGLGNQPWVLRLPAFIAGVLLVPATYALTRLLFTPGAAPLGAALVAVSSYLVEYSTNGRGYTLQALCFVVMLALSVFAVRRQSLTALLLAGIVAATGAWAVPTMLYGVVVSAAWLLVELRGSRLFGSPPRGTHLVATGLAIGLIAILLYLPVIVVSGPDKLVANRFVVPPAGGELIGELARSLAQTWVFWNRDVPAVIAAVLVIGFALGSWRVPLGLPAAAICLACVLVQRVAPFERVWLFLLPLYFAIAGGGLARFVDGRLLATAFGLMLGYFTLTSGSILSSTETGVFPDAEAVARALGPRLAPDDAVVTELPASLPELQYYFPRFGLPTNVLVRSADEAQNLWVIATPGASPAVEGWRTVIEVERLAASELFELKR